MPVKPPCYTDKLAMLQRCQQTKESRLLQQLPLILSGPNGIFLPAIGDKSFRYPRHPVDAFDRMDGQSDQREVAGQAVQPAARLTNLSEP